MKIIDLKNALNLLGLSTTGNKLELKVMLQEAGGRRQPVLGKTADGDARVTCEESATSDEEMMGEVTSDDEGKRTDSKQVSERIKKKYANRKSTRYNKMVQSELHTRGRGGIV